MKRIVGLALVSAGLLAASADVFSDAHFWLRGGLATDLNGNGLLDNNEISDSLGRTSFTSDVFDGGKTLAFANETVRLPTRGTAATMQVLRFPQIVGPVDEEGTAKARSNAVRLNGVLKDYTDQYSFVIRFRLDPGMPMNKDWTWLLNMGYSYTGNGLMLGFNGRSENRPLRLFGYQGNDLELCSVTNAAWTDVGVAIDGSNVTWVVNATTGLNEDRSNIQFSTMRWGARAINLKGYSTRPQYNDLVIGTESTYDGEFTIKNALTQPDTSHNAGKAFRGSLQQLAFWKRALTLDELREAIAWPNVDVLKIGVADGSAAEFSGEGDSGSAQMDDRTWNIPRAIPAGGSVTLRFPLRAKHNDKLPQVLRWTSTPDSPTARLGVELNGRTVDGLTVRPGAVSRLFVPGAFFQAGENTLVLTRTDAGTQPLRLDALALGGSWAVGLDDAAYLEFGHEGSSNVDYWILDGNMKDVRRALLGQSITNQFWHFSLPADLAGRYDARFTIKTRSAASNGTMLNIDFDGVNFASKPMPVHGDTFTRDLSAEELLGGPHVFNLRNGVSGSGYWSPDYATFELIPAPTGTMMLVR